MLDIKIPGDIGQKILLWLKVVALACIVFILLHLFLQMVELEFACDAQFPTGSPFERVRNAGCYWGVLWGGRG
ncbi:MAG: hypothetical protein MPK31_08510 [Gammaproteobacteria bacterium]|nr:hypothetical protein [Gammaproteobacteria bacterium]MDA8003025.1 hypothetical protein [Alphaproteobacteria bacterium]